MEILEKKHVFMPKVKEILCDLVKKEVEIEPDPEPEMEPEKEIPEQKTETKDKTQTKTTPIIKRIMKPNPVIKEIKADLSEVIISRPEFLEESGGDYSIDSVYTDVLNFINGKGGQKRAADIKSYVETKYKNSSANVEVPVRGGRQARVLVSVNGETIIVPKEGLISIKP